MMETTSPTTAQTAVQTDLLTAIQEILAASPEPLTVPKIRSKLPSSLRGTSVEEIAECLKRPAAASVLIQFPKYRSQQDRFWDRPMAVHIAALLREVLQEGPLNFSELRRKLPAYAVAQAESVLMEQVNQGILYKHPRVGKRGGDRFGIRPADPKDYLLSELAQVFQRLEQLGFSQSQLREAALEILHEDEWASALAQASAESSAKPGSTTDSTPEASPEPPTSEMSNTPPASNP
jgi:hypothetical protein